jgi:hypothetical protein
MNLEPVTSEEDEDPKNTSGFDDLLRENLNMFGIKPAA